MTRCPTLPLFTALARTSESAAALNFAPSAFQLLTASWCQIWPHVLQSVYLHYFHFTRYPSSVSHVHASSVLPNAAVLQGHFGQHPRQPMWVFRGHLKNAGLWGGGASNKFSILVHFGNMDQWTQRGPCNSEPTCCQLPSAPLRYQWCCCAQGACEAL